MTTAGMVVNLAPTGMVPTRADSPHVPLSVDEIVRDVVDCLSAGVNVVHLHARDDAGRPTWRREVYGRIIEGVRNVVPDAVLGVSLSGRDFPEFERRADVLELPADLRPDLGSLTLSSMNFVTQASTNTPEMIRRLADRMAGLGIKPELEAFDAGMVHYGVHLAERGVIAAPLYFNLILGNVASAQPTPSHLAAMVAELPSDCTWTIGGVGRAQLASNVLGMIHGHGVRVGLEDNLWFDTDRTELATNRRLVDRCVSIARQLGREPMSADDVRRRLGLRLR